MPSPGLDKEVVIILREEAVSGLVDLARNLLPAIVATEEEVDIDTPAERLHADTGPVGRTCSNPDLGGEPTSSPLGAEAPCDSQLVTECPGVPGEEYPRTEVKLLSVARMQDSRPPFPTRARACPTTNGVPNRDPVPDSGAAVPRILTEPFRVGVPRLGVVLTS